MDKLVYWSKSPGFLQVALIVLYARGSKPMALQDLPKLPLKRGYESLAAVGGLGGPRLGSTDPGDHVIWPLRLAMQLFRANSVQSTELPGPSQRHLRIGLELSEMLQLVHEF